MTAKELDILALFLIVLTDGFCVWRWRSASKKCNMRVSRLALYGFLSGVAGFLLFLSLIYTLLKYDYFNVAFPFIGYNQMRFSMTLTALAVVFMVVTSEICRVLVIRNQPKILSDGDIESIGNQDLP